MSFAAPIDRDAPTPSHSWRARTVTQYSYHISHEQFAPSELLRFVVEAENAGFDAAFSSDHLQPWAREQGHAGFAWSWLGAAMQATRHLKFGVISVPSGWRYRPEVLAQAIATLGEMFPGRLPWIALGSGEALNEYVCGAQWPSKQLRNKLLKEGAEIIRALLAGETVNHDGDLHVEDARIWSLPPSRTKLVGAALSEDTAQWLGQWADGLLTCCPNVEHLQRIIDAFRRGGGEGKPLYLKFDLSWARGEEEALLQAHAQWRFNAVGGDASCDLHTPEEFERAAGHIRPEDMRQHVCVAANLEMHIERLRHCASLGFESIDLHNVGKNQSEFIEVFGKQVLPALRNR